MQAVHSNPALEYRAHCLYMISVVVRFYFPLKSAPALSEHCHEADARMTGPLVFLTVLMIVLSLMSSGLYSWIGGMV